MNSFSWANFAVVTASSIAALVVLHGVTFAIGRRLGRFNVVDVAWGLGFVLVGAIALGVGDGSPGRRILLFILTVVWGIRLSWHMFRKSAGKGEDPRYREMLERSGGSSTAVVIRKVFLVQGGAQWFVSLPLQVSAATGPTKGFGSVVAFVGVVLWAVGLIFETVGDYQLAHFKADPANKGTVMDRGLWAWTRHPNYFGDASVWWGLWLVAASVWPGVLTVLSPVVMTYFLVFATGARLLEKSMVQRPGYPEYQQRTSYFLPRPPR